MDEDYIIDKLIKFKNIEYVTVNDVDYVLYQEVVDNREE